MIQENPTIDLLPPSDIDAEKCALSAMMLCGDDRTLFKKIRRQLHRGAFYQPDHQIIFDALVHLHENNRPIDSVITMGELRQRGVLESVGGASYIGEILHTMPSAFHGEEYARRVSERARERDAISICNRMANRLMQPIGDINASDIIQRAISDLWRVGLRGKDLRIWKLSDAEARFVEQRKTGTTTAIDTGFRSLDDNFRGILRYGGYTLVAARPSMGKSTFIRDRLLDRAKTGVSVGLIAVEEDAMKIAGNSLSSETEIENSHLAYGTLSQNEWGQVDDAVASHSELPYHGIDTAFSLPDILAAAEMLATQFKCQIIAIDHIHLVKNTTRTESREQQISEISSAFKEFIKRLNIAGIVAAQLNRPEKGICPPPPALTDLRGSGALEEHADSVLMLHREDYYFRGRGDYMPNGLCQIFIRKNRNGAVGEVVMSADLKHQKFKEREDDIPQF